MSIQLTVMSLDFDSSGTPITKTYDKSEITLGRFPENDVILDKPEVSGIHARLRFEQGSSGAEPRLFISDLGSSNGTLVENNSLSAQVEVEMNPNERIIIGNYLIKPTVYKGLVEDPDEAEETVVFASDEELLEDPLESTSLFSEANDVDDASEDEDIVEVEAEEIDPLDRPIASESFFDEAPTIQMRADDLFSAKRSEEPAVNGSTYAGDSESAASVTTSSFGSSFGQSIVIDLEGDDALDIDFSATALFDVSGAITHKGNPLADVSVDGGALGSTMTDSAGRYSFSDIAEGTEYQIRAEKDGYLFEGQGTSGSLESDTTVPFTAIQLFVIRGSITHRGLPLAGARVDGGDLGTRITDESGTFAFEDVSEFTHYRISVSKDRFIFSADKDSGELGSSDESLSFSGRQLFTISGRVTNNGQPLEGVEIDAGPLGKTTTSSDGVYSFENVPEGEKYTITAQKERFRVERS